MDVEVPEFGLARGLAMAKTGFFDPFRCNSAGDLAFSMPVGVSPPTGMLATNS
jgi:hypothetical protein